MKIRIAALLMSLFAVACSRDGAGSTPAAPQVALPDALPGVHAVDSSDFALARSLQSAGPPHVTYTRFNNPFKSFSRPNGAPNGYPLDMSCQTKACAVQDASTEFNLYVNCKDESCWGNPETFIKSLRGSPFLGLIGQYTKGAASKYTFGGSFPVKYALPYSNTFYQNDIFAVLAAGLKHFQKVGLHYQYNIFLPKGIDTCFDHTNQCYSPDDLSSFYFCAYHEAAKYNGQPIVYTVIPYDDVTVQYSGQSFSACHVPNNPKGTDELASATASALSHEMFEAWSDPLPNSGWYNAPFGAEIGDICAYRFMQTLKLGTHAWYIQTEYSNEAHACASH